MIKVLHRISTPEKKRVIFTARELAVLYHIQRFPTNNTVRVEVPKSGKKQIYRITNWYPTTYSSYMATHVIESDIDWDKVNILHLNY